MSQELTNFQNKDVVLVGNGPSALEKKVGHIIDSKDFVVRFNHYVLDGYEEYVGTRVDMWFVHHGQKGNGKLVKNWNGKLPKYLFVPWGSDPTMNKVTKMAIMKFGDHEYVELHTNRTTDFCRDLVRNFKDILGFPPTSGFLAINAFLQKGARVYIHGFDMLDKSKLNNTTYYFGRTEKNIIDRIFEVHDPAAEAEWVAKLIKEGKVIVL